MHQQFDIISPRKDTLFFELSGEHATLPKAEIFAVLWAHEIQYEIIEEDVGILIIEAPGADIFELRNRLALSHSINGYFASYDASDLLNFQHPMGIENGSFAVRAKRIEGFHKEIDLKKLEKDVADSTLGNRKVDLSSPENEVRVLLSNRGHIGILKAIVPRNTFEERKVQNRPYFSPVSLHPRLARALVNLSRVSRGQKLLDPFCGTGGILMEASLVGAKVMGSDIDSQMVQGSKDNLAKFKMIDVEVLRSDVGSIIERISDVDAVATDPPYGKSATTNRENIKNLYERAYLAISEVLKSGGFLSIVLPDPKLIELGRDHFELVECHPQRVHRSLTRNFCVFQNL